MCVEWSGVGGGGYYQASVLMSRSLLLQPPERLGGLPGEQTELGTGRR